MLGARRIALALLVLAALAVLSVRSRVVGAEDDNRTIDGARRLRELDIRLDMAVLEAKSGLTLDYDTLTIELRAMDAIQREIEEASAKRPDPHLLPHVAAARARIVEKERLLETFESSNSLFMNSLTYLPLAAREASTSAPPDIAPRLDPQIDELLAGVLHCTLDCGASSLAQVRRSIDAISMTRELSPPDARGPVDVLLRHARLFARVAPEVESAVRGLVVGNDSSYDDLYLAARDRRDAAIERANGYRALLIALCMGLLGGIAAMLVRLHRNAAALQQALQGLDREKHIVEEKQSELATLNEHLEVRVEERTHELSASREEYRALLETTDAIPWGMAPDSLRFAYVGPQAVRSLGYPLADWTREGFLDARIHPEDIGEAKRALEALSADGSHDEIELRMRAADGREVWLRGFVNTTHDGQARPVRRGIFLDVTARRMLEAQLRAAQKLESLGRLSAGIAHEINTPIQFVTDSVQFIKNAFTDMATLVATYRRAIHEELTLEERPRLAAAAREADSVSDIDYTLENVPEAIESSLEGLGRIATIVKSLKEFSHPDRREKSAVDLNANIRSTLAIAANEYKHVADVELELGELSPVVCHGGELNQVVLNLVVNAAHAIGDVVKTSNQRGRIKVRTWQEQSTVCLCVRDTGPGIPSEIHDRIFDPFFTTKEVGRGTGQGLALARKIVVDQHGGLLTFETELGRGTAFFIRLPLGDARPATATAA